MSNTRRFIPLILLAAACGEFIPNPLGPGSGGGGGDGGSGEPSVALPFKYGGLDLDEGRAVTAVPGGAIVASWFTGTVDFDPRAAATLRNSLGGQDVAIAKYDDDGAFQWVYSLGSAGAEVPSAITATADGGAVVVGHGAGGVCGGRGLIGQGSRDILILKMSADGICEWAQLFGGSEDDEALAVTVEQDGSIVVAGYFNGTVDFDPSGAAAILQSFGSADAFLARFSSDGTFLEALHAGGAEDDRYDAIALSADQEITVVGTFRGLASFGSELAPVVLVSAGQSDAVVARYTQFFGLRWAKRLGGQLDDRATAVAIDATGNPLVGGGFEGVADLDPGTGAVLVVSQGEADIFMVRLRASSGEWDGVAESVGGAGGDGITDLVGDGSGLVLATGWFQGTVDFDPGAGTTLLVSKGTAGSGDGFLAAFSPGNGLAWASQFGGVVAGGDNLSIAAGVSLDGAGAVWSTGRFFGRTDFDPLSGVVELTPAGKSDGYLARYRVTSGVLEVVDIPEAGSL